MMRWSIYSVLQWMSSDHVRIVYQDSPEIYEDEETKIQHSMQWEDEDEDVIRERLKIAVHRMEGI